MEKYEIVLSVKAYKAGYAQACEDICKDFISSHSEVFRTAMAGATKKMDGNMKRACETYLDSLNNGGKA